jgi:hypothetical protein
MDIGRISLRMALAERTSLETGTPLFCNGARYRMLRPPSIIMFWPVI